MKRIIMLSYLLIVGVETLLAQDTAKNELKITGYAEVYYQRDFNNPENNSRPEFIYSHNRNNEVSLNLGLVKAAYQTDRLRTNLGLGVGSYMNANYASEAGVLKNIYEANIGIKLSKKHNLWLDAGVLPSHIGSESALGAACYTLTRSLMAENSPYFETGAKLSYGSANSKWDFAFLVLNGWQRIQKVDGNSSPSFGHQIQFHPNQKVLLNSSSIIGNDRPDTQRQMVYFHDFYGEFQLGNKVSLITGFDFGAQQITTGKKDIDTWYAASIIAKYSLKDKLSLAARIEYYSDKKGLVIGTGTPNGFQTLGASLNVDYHILPKLVWRTEVKRFISKDAVFSNRSHDLKQGSFIAITSLAVQF